jgi:hypothetical protein
MGYVAGWFIFSVLVGWIWEQRGLSFFKGLLISLLLSPLIGFIVGIFSKPPAPVPVRATTAERDIRKCPFCAEAIKHEAIICRYCGNDVVSAPSPVDQENIERALARMFFDTGMYEADLDRMLSETYKTDEAAQEAKVRILAMRQTLSA